MSNDIMKQDTASVANTSKQSDTIEAPTMDTPVVEQRATTLYDATRNTTYQILNALEDHKRTIIRDIIDTVVATTGCPSTIANGLVPMFCHDWADAGNGTVEKGRTGGVYKNGPLKRTDQRPRCETCHQVLRPVKVYPGSIEDTEIKDE